MTELQVLRRERLDVPPYRNPEVPVLVDAGGRPIRSAQAAGERSQVFDGRQPSPGIPLAPLYAPGAFPRQFFTRPGANLNFVPRREFPELTPFQLLRNLADASDIVRLAIEDVKNQVVALEWDVHSIDDKAADRLAPNIARVKEFFKRPDRQHSFRRWLAMLLEDCLVCDALTFYRRRTVSGEPYAMLPIDGSTIKPIVDFYGIAPDPPETAFQQYGYGRIEADFHRPYFHRADLAAALSASSSDPSKLPVELVYEPRSPRPFTPYGQSPVERVLITVNLALRRQLHYLAFYTDGNIPEAFWKCPSNWEPHHVETMQDTFDKMLTGELGLRRKLRFMPGGEGAGLENPRGADEWKKEFDEYLARVVCYAFNTSPLPLVQLMNRASGEMADAEESDSGHHPLMRFVEEFLTREIHEFLNEPELQFIWIEDKEADERLDFERNVAYIDRGVYEVDEVRAQKGKEKTGIPRYVMTPAGPVPVADLFGALPDAAGATPDGTAPKKSPLDVPLPPAAGGGSALVAPAPTKPVPSGGPGPVPAAGQDAAVADTALNGAQIESVVLIAQEVAAGRLPLATGVELLTAAFPTWGVDRARRLLSPAADIAPPAEGKLEGKEAEVGGAAASASPDAGVAARALDVPLPPAAGKSATGPDAGAEREDLRRWRKVALKALGSGQRSPADFESRAIRPGLAVALKEWLADARTKEDVEWAFRSLVKAARPLVSARRRLRLERKLRSAVREHFESVAGDVAKVALADFAVAKGAAPGQDAQVAAFLKAGISGDDLDEALKLDAFVDVVKPTLAESFLEGETLASGASGIEIAFGLTDIQATTYAAARSAELVGKRVLPDGTVVDNPNPKWAISESLRDSLNLTITKAFSDGWTEDELREAIESPRFWTWRADMIARTEVAVALNKGTVEAYAGVGVEKVKIYDGPGCLMDGHDDSQAGVNGTIVTLDEFDENPIGHPNCRRDASPVIPEEE